jgi:hypothetical protein
LTQKEVEKVLLSPRTELQAMRGKWSKFHSYLLKEDCSVNTARYLSVGWGKVLSCLWAKFCPNQANFYVREKRHSVGQGRAHGSGE